MRKTKQIPRPPYEINKEIYELENIIVSLYQNELPQGYITEKDIEKEENKVQKLKKELQNSYDYYEKHPLKSEENEIKTPQKRKETKDEQLVKAEKKVADPDALPGFDVQELKSNKLHNLLSNSKLYKFYYMLWRLKINGNYEFIPIEFLTMISSFLFYDNKLEIKSRNFKHTRLNTIALGISGSGKSLPSTIAKTLGDRLNIPVVKMSSTGTTANMRGTVKVEGNVPIIMPGAMKNAFIYADEFLSVVKTFLKDENASSFYLEILEDDEIDAGTAESKKLINILDNPTTKKERELSNKVQTQLSKYNWRYDDLHHRFLAQNNSTVCFKGQALTQGSTNIDKQAQDYAITRGLFGRCLFFWNNKKTSLEDEKTKTLQRAEFIKKRKEITQLNEEELEEKYVNDFVTLYENLPEYRQMYINNIDIDVNALKLYDNSRWINLAQYCKELQDEDNDLGNKIEAQMNRYKWRHLPVLVFIIGYLKQEQYPSTETWDECIEIIIDSLENFRDYLESTTESKIWTKKGQIKDYTNPIIKFIRKLYQESYETNKDELEIVSHYPNKSVFDKRFKEYFKATVADSFSNKMYNKAIKNLENMEAIKITNENPVNNKKFKNNSYKIMLWNRNENKPRGAEKQ